MSTWKPDWRFDWRPTLGMRVVGIRSDAFMETDKMRAIVGRRGTVAADDSDEFSANWVTIRWDADNGDASLPGRYEPDGTRIIPRVVLRPLDVIEELADIDRPTTRG